jgi:hypothetical protein
MVKSIKRVQAHYESREMPFGKTYEWHPANIIARAIQDGEATLPEEFSRPWFYDEKERAQQHQRDEEAYPEGSSWRYNDITAATNEE